MPPANQAISEPRRTAAQVGSQAFCLVFALAGVAFLWFMARSPLHNVVPTRSWVPVPCEILSAEVDEWTSSDGTTYKAAIRYRYVFEDRLFEGDQYAFFPFYSNGYEDKAQVVERHPPGSHHTAWVNPKAPGESVLNRDLTPAFLLTLAPLAFIAIGVGGFFVTGRKPVRRGTPPQACGHPGTVLPDGTIELRPRRRRSRKLLPFVVIAIFWNGLVSVFVVATWQEASPGGPEWYLILFLTPFAIVGLGLLWAVVFHILAFSNPGLRVTAGPSTVGLGGNLHVAWAMTGGVRRLRNLRMTLEGLEEATYTRGTDTTVDASVFARLPILATTDQAAIRAGVASLTIPHDAMHSFNGGKNRIIWRVKAQAEVPLFPDVEEEYEIIVGPAIKETT